MIKWRDWFIGVGFCTMLIMGTQYYKYPESSVIELWFFIIGMIMIVIGICLKLNHLLKNNKCLQIYMERINNKKKSRR